MTPAALDLMGCAAGIFLHALRLAPAAMLSPFLGGPLVPPAVRLSLAGGLGAAAWALRGGAPASADPLSLVAGAFREVAVGLLLAMAAAAPLEAARAGGRLADTFRGATLAELHVAPVRQRETAVGDLLAQWVVVLAAWSGADRLVLRGILGTFAALPPGAPFPRGSVLEGGLFVASEIVASAVAVAAPAAAGVLAADLAVTLAARVAPQLGAVNAAQPARAALGLLAVAAAASAMAGRLVALCALSAGLPSLLARAGGAP
ncbi:MAG TPA: flagellar biosynthetic protein FliR [Anaeromyxobacteraceae bacterium]|nr:flagellar biosynthetic protein FliR [Anaeromyxobacteraceae bacterium]